MSGPAVPPSDAPRPRRRLFWKYVVVIVALVTTLLVASGGVELWFSYQESRDAFVALQREKAAAAAGRIEAFIREIERQMGWTTLPLLASGSAALEQRRIDFVRLQRQVQPITDLSYLDAGGKEQLRVSRLAIDVVGSGIDFSADPRFTQAVARKVYHGPVYFRKESEPYMVVAMAQSGGGVTVAEVNLKFIWDVVTQIKIGKAGRAYVIDDAGNLIAHPDISLVLQKTSLSALPQVREALAAGAAATPVARDVQGRRVLTAHATIPGLRWTVFAEQPLEEALAPIESSLKRSLVLLAIGVFLAIGASLVLARRMVRPIQALQVGAARIGGGELGHRIEVRTGDELQALATEFNRMTATLQESYATLEQRVEDRTRELSESLEQQTATSEILRVISRSPTDEQPVLDVIAQRAKELCDGVYGAVYRVRGEMMHFVAHSGFSASVLEDFRQSFPVPLTSLPGTTFGPQGFTYLPDLEGTPNIPAGTARRARLAGYRALVIVPMFREGQLVGTIAVGKRQPASFTEKQIALLKTFADQAVIAIENVRLFKELEARNADLGEALEQQTGTAEILRVISSSPTDLQPVFEAILEKATQLCDAHLALLGRYDGQHYEHIAHRGAPAEFQQDWMGRPMPYDASTGVGRMIAAGQPVHIPDVMDDPAYRSGHPVRMATVNLLGARTFLAVPMLKEGRVVGGIVIYRPEVRPFSAKQIDLVRIFADQAVIAIENVRLFKELEAKNATLTETLEQQTATSEVLAVISESPTDVEPVFAAILRNGLRLSGASYGAVLRFEAGVFRLSLASEVRPEMEEHLRTIGIPAGTETPLARVGLELRPVTTADIQNDPRFSLPDPHRREGMRSALAVPMLREGRLVGALAFHTREVRPFTDKQVEVVSTFARQAVIAIENVRLFKELESRNAALSESLEQQTATAEILRVISSSPTDIQPVLEVVAQKAAHVCGASDALIRRVEGDLMTQAAHFGEVPMNPSETRAITRDSVSGRAILERRTIHLHNLLDPEFAREYPEGAALQRQAGYRTIVATPLLREGSAVGVMMIRRMNPDPFTDKQIALLETFANQAVIAIENVRLFTELQQRNAEVTEALEQQTATAEILRVISQSPTDVQPVLDAVAESAARVCNAADALVVRVESGMLRLAAHFGSLPIPAAAPIRPVDTTRGPASRAILERRTIHIHDLSSALDEYPDALEPNLRTMLVSPLLREGTAVGVILLRRTEMRPFTDKQITLLETFADQAVIAIENVRLFTELQQRNAEVTEALEQQTATAEILSVISSSPTDVQPVLDVVAQNAARVCGALDAIISRVEGDHARRVAHFGSLPLGPDSVLPPSTRTITRGSVLGRAVVERRTIQVADMLDEPVAEDFPEGVELARRMGHRTVMATPLVREGVVTGVIIMRRAEVRPFSDKQVALLETFASQAVIAIENVRLFTELQERTSQLLVASRHKDEFLANMSHELRTPLNAIIGFSEVMLERMFGELNDKQDEYLNDILSSGRHLLSLINDILDLSKIEAGRMELELTDFDFPVAIDNALTLVHERAARRGLTLTQDIDARLGEFRGDERKIKQVLLNLLSNAIKFTPEGGKVQVRAHLKGAVVEIAVADTGVGIAPEDQELVFEEFQQVGTDVAKKHEGTGLGLALARRFVELHGGNLWLESEVGVGSTFSFELPVRR